MGKTEESLAAVVIVVLLILSNLGAAAMLVGSLIALCGYMFFFKQTMRDRRASHLAAICLATGLVVAAATALIVSLF